MLRKSKNLPRTKSRKESAEDKIRESIRTNASKKTQISKLCSSKLLSLSQPSLLQKRQGGFNPPPNPGRRVRPLAPGLNSIEAPLGGVQPPNVFGVRRLAIRKGVQKNKALRFEFSWRRSYGFCSRLCPRQVLGFSALSSASSWIFLAKLVEDLVSQEAQKIIQTSQKIEP